MSPFIFTVMILLPFGFILFYLIQSRIGDEQKRERRRFVEQNSHLEMYLKLCPTYAGFYLKRPPLQTSECLGGMTETQKKNSLRKCGPATTLV